MMPKNKKVKEQMKNRAEKAEVQWETLKINGLSVLTVRNPEQL